jgi:hemoglobin-like flavoprotein
MDARKISLVQASFEQVATLGVKAAEIFYAELFAIDPSLRAMFKCDMHEQQKKLLNALSLVVRALHTPEKIIGPVEKLAIKHLDCGVQPEHYTYVATPCCAPSRRAWDRNSRLNCATPGSMPSACWRKS